MPHLKESGTRPQMHPLCLFIFPWESTDWCLAFMECVHTCLPANHGFMLDIFFLSISSCPHEEFSCFIFSPWVCSGVELCQDILQTSSHTCTPFLPFLFHSRTVLVTTSICRKMLLYCKNVATYELWNILVGTYPVAEHYRDCGQDLDGDSWVRKSKY